MKRSISSFDGREKTQVRVGKTEATQTVDVIITDFGTVKVMPSRWLPKETSTASFSGQSTALLLDPMYLAVAFFRNFFTRPMGRIGDADTRVIVAEWGVEMRNAKAHILFRGFNDGDAIGVSV